MLYSCHLSSSTMIAQETGMILIMFNRMVDLLSGTPTTISLLNVPYADTEQRISTAKRDEGRIKSAVIGFLNICLSRHK